MDMFMLLGLHFIKLSAEKTEQYIQDDSEMSKILLSLGCEDVQFERKTDKHLFTEENIKTLIEHFLKIESLGGVYKDMVVL